MDVNAHITPPPGIEPGSPKGPDLKSGALPLCDRGLLFVFLWSICEGSSLPAYATEACLFFSEAFAREEFPLPAYATEAYNIKIKVKE